MGGGRQIFELLAGEDIEGDNVRLGVTVLSSLGGRHFDNLAGASLNDDVTVLPQSGTLHRESLGRAGLGGLEDMLVLYIQAKLADASSRNDMKTLLRSDWKCSLLRMTVKNVS